MNSFLVFIVLAAFAAWLINKPIELEDSNTELVQGHLKRLWQDAYQNLNQNNVARAERSLLALLKIDEKNVSAYNRLGIIYARQGLKKEAIDCFEISNGLASNSGSLHNLALVYFHDKQYKKAARAFEVAIEKDPKNPFRYVALAKTLEKMGDTKSAIKELEKAHRVDPGGSASILLEQSYRQVGQEELASEVNKEANHYRLLKAKSKAAAQA